MNFLHRPETVPRIIDQFAPDPDFVTIFSQTSMQASNVLDLGCGNGNNALYMANQGHTVTGIETSSSSIKECQAKARFLSTDAARRVSFEVGAAATPFILGLEFDAIVLTKALHRLSPNHRSPAIFALNCIRQATRPGGLNIISAYVGTPKDQKLVPSYELLQKGELESICEKSGWGVLYTREVRKPAITRNKVPIIRSVDEIVIRKPEVARSRVRKAASKSKPAYSTPHLQASVDSFQKAGAF